jgi:hypothetical protein
MAELVVVGIVVVLVALLAAWPFLRGRRRRPGRPPVTDRRPVPPRRPDQPVPGSQPDRERKRGG